MEKKAEAWQKYNEAAIMQILAPILPEIARAVAEPLSRIDRITMVNTGNGQDPGMSRITGEVAKVIATMPTVIESLTGVKISELVESMRRTGHVSGDVVPPPTTSGDADPPAPASKGKNPAT